MNERQPNVNEVMDIYITNVFKSSINDCLSYHEEGKFEKRYEEPVSVGKYKGFTVKQVERVKFYCFGEEDSDVTTVHVSRIIGAPENNYRVKFGMVSSPRTSVIYQFKEGGVERTVQNIPEVESNSASAEEVEFISGILLSKQEDVVLSVEPVDHVLSMYQ